MFGNQIQTLLLLLDLDIVVFIIVFLLASKSRVYFRGFRFSYTSLGHALKSKSRATSENNNQIQPLELFPNVAGLTITGTM